MNRLIKDGDVILDGTLTKKDKIKQAFEKLEDIEELMECYEIEDLVALHRILYLAYSLGEVKLWKARNDNIIAMVDQQPNAEEKLQVLIKAGKI